MKATTSDKCICSECGSTDVELRAWVNQETGEIDYSCAEDHNDDSWCNNCKEHTSITFG